MRRITILLLFLGGLAVLAGSASANPITVNVTLYETGDGYWGASAIPYQMQNDPGPGGAAQPVLTYLPAPLPGAMLVTGDLIGPALRGSTQVSDLIRVNPGNQIVFYSGGIPNGSPLLVILNATPGDTDFESGFFDLPNSIADTTTWPTALYNNQLMLSSELTFNGTFIYTPLANQPGFDSLGLYAITYYFVSDVSVPEPSTLALFGAGAIGLLGCMWRRRS